MTTIYPKDVRYKLSAELAELTPNIHTNIDAVPVPAGPETLDMKVAYWPTPLEKQELDYTFPQEELAKFDPANPEAFREVIKEEAKKLMEQIQQPITA